MIVADASGLVALGSVGAIQSFVDEFDVRSTSAVFASIEASVTRHGPDGRGARTVLEVADGIDVIDPDGQPIRTSRIDAPLGSAVVLARELDASFFLTDSNRAVHELRQLSPGTVVAPPVVMLALVRRGILSQVDAGFRVETLLERHRGLEAAVAAHARELFEANRS